MAFKFVILASLLAVANAGYIGAPSAYAAYAAPYASHAVGSQSQSVLRSADGNNVISTYSKAVDSAYSSVRKYDTRVSNDAIIAGHAPVAYAAPAVAHAPLAYAAPAVAHAPLAYAAPVAKVAAPVAYASPAYAHGYAAPAYAHGYAAPAVAHGYAAPVAAHAGLLGVAYSAAPTVAHISYSNGYGINYAY